MGAAAVVIAATTAATPPHCLHLSIYIGKN
jgi:hypothetical protein